VPVVVVGAPFGHAGHHRQHRLGPVERLDLGLLVHAQHHGPLRRVVVEADHIDDLLHEQRVGGQLEPVQHVRFELEPLPDPPDRGFAQPAALSHRGPGPVGGVLGQLLQGRHHHILDLVEQDRGRPTGTLFVQQTVQTGGHEPGSPSVHGAHAHPELRRDLLVRRALSAGQHNPCPHRQELRRLSPPRPPCQLGPLRLGQHQVGLRPPDPRSVLQPGQPAGREPRPPRPHGRNADRKLLRHGGIRPALGARQHNAGAFAQPSRPALHGSLQGPPLRRRQHDLHGARPRMRHHNSILT
jgi:hypothetical protein